MERLLKRRKGFTLVELIIVIVILAILIAALIPAVMGAIGRARTAADQANARTVLTAASVAVLADNGTIKQLTGEGAINVIGPDNSIVGNIQGGLGNFQPGMVFTIHFENVPGTPARSGMPVGVTWTSGRAGNGTLGTVTGTFASVLNITVSTPSTNDPTFSVTTPGGGVG